jgi:hypothetical protein
MKARLELRFDRVIALQYVEKGLEAMVQQAAPGFQGDRSQ